MSLIPCIFLSPLSFWKGRWGGGDLPLQFPCYKLKLDLRTLNIDINEGTMDIPSKRMHDSILLVFAMDQSSQISNKFERIHALKLLFSSKGQRIYVSSYAFQIEHINADKNVRDKDHVLHFSVQLKTCNFDSLIVYIYKSVLRMKNLDSKPTLYIQI